MKKFLMMALMAASVTTALAQDPVKDARKLLNKNDFSGAISTLAPALNDGTAAQKAAAWNLQSDIYYKVFTQQQETALRNNVPGQAPQPVDSVAMYDAAVKAWEAALQSDEYAQQPDDKGKVKNRVRSGFQTRFRQHGGTLVQGGQYFYQLQQYDNALKSWKLYLAMKDSPIFAEVSDYQREPFYYDIAYYVSFLSYQQELYAQAIEYAHLCAQDPAKVDEANEILLFAMKDNARTHEDTLQYVNYVKEQHQANPTNERFFNLLVDYYSHLQDNDAMLQWATEEVALIPQNKMAWYIKGYSHMMKSEWDPAIEAYGKAIEIDPDYTEAIFNNGICIYQKSRALQDQLANPDGTIAPANKQRVQELVRECLPFLEKARQLDPAREKCNWAYPLYQAYYALQDTAKMTELEAIDPSLRND
ncbi:MAG: tetratricopeptide repeat protein [Prevotella sp.]|nr:tetratricopeptide repeat protein [Prevotella sp.]